MRIEDFVSKLDKVRQTGSNKWIACCPAHEDRTPSLGISEGEDGRILIKCFAECSIENIVGAVGCTLSDIMPEKALAHRMNPIRKPFPAADTLEMLAFESKIVWLAACDMAKGKKLTPEEKKRLDTAANRIEVAIHG